MSTGKEWNLLGLLRGQRDVKPAQAPTVSLAPHEVINDATGYGVQIHPANVAPGALYWQAVRVHHRTPEENGGNHHLYLDVFDPTLGGEPYGGRVNGARLRVTWDGGEQIVTVDKPANEPGTNFPMWKWQVCAVECLGLPEQELPSDRVTGLHTGHPDEAAGNTLFHHSFHVTYAKAQAAEQVYTDSVIYGVIHNGSGRTALLLKGEQEVARKVLGVDETFRFAELGAGEYLIAVENSDFRSTLTRVNGRDQVQLDLTLALRQSAISGRVRNGAGLTVTLLKETIEVAKQTVAADETYRFSALEAGAYRVVIAGTQVASETLNLNGVNAATADLSAPVQGKFVAHYVLFGPNDRPRTRAHLLLAQDFILTFQPTLGFNAEEAGAASSVTIIGGLEDVSADIERRLATGEATVQRIAGSAEEVTAALAARIASGRAFG
jgi:hypothetical protein